MNGVIIEFPLRKLSMVFSGPLKTCRRVGESQGAELCNFTIWIVVSR